MHVGAANTLLLLDELDFAWMSSQKLFISQVHELLVPKETQDIPYYPLHAAAKSWLLQLASTKANAEMYKLLFLH